MSKLEIAIDFGPAGNSHEYITRGFGDPEGGHIWTVGPLSQMLLPIRTPGEPHVIVLRVKPFLHEPRIQRQSIKIAIDAQVIASFTIPREVVFGLRISGEMAKRSELVVSIFHEDWEESRTVGTFRDGQSLGLMILGFWLFSETPRKAAKIKTLAAIDFDGNGLPLAQAFKNKVGSDLAEVAASFESLGHRCAYGLFQQRFGAHPVGLLRFAGLSTPRLVHNLVTRFDRLGDAENLRAFIPENSKGPYKLYRIYDQHAEIWYNTSHRMEEAEPQEVVALAARRLPFLRRKFLEELELAEKIFVLNSPWPMTEPEALAIFVALDLYGRNRLLWTNQDGTMPVGAITRLSAGFYYGQLDRLGFEGDSSDTAWCSLIANAAALRDEERTQT
jgi:hypothetical protein